MMKPVNIDIYSIMDSMDLRIFCIISTDAVAENRRQLAKLSTVE